MSKAGIDRLRRIADQACDERRPPRPVAKRLQLLAELYGTRSREPDLFTPLDPAGAGQADKAA